MMIDDRSRPQRIRLFRDERLERLTVFTPRAFALTWSVMLGLAVYASWGVESFAMSASFALVGGIVWTLFEYGMHRFVFHLKITTDFVRWLVFVTHGNHHADPNDRARNIMPPVVSVPLLSAFWGFFCALVGPAGSIVFLGFAIGYVIYDSVHYACHQFPMRGPILRRLKRHHNRHHYAREEGNYAITAIFWDRLFGSQLPISARAPAKASRSHRLAG